MGADLYIDSLCKARRDKYSEKFKEAVASRDRYCKELECLRGKRDRATKNPYVLSVTEKINLYTELVEAAQKEVERYESLMFGSPGYFRDSYNGTSVLHPLGLSWWKDAPDGTLIMKDYAKLENFLNKVVSRKLKPVTLADLKESHCKVDDNENSVKVWQKFFRNKKRRLVRFLNRALKELETGGTVTFSV